MPPLSARRQSRAPHSRRYPRPSWPNGAPSIPSEQIDLYQPDSASVELSEFSDITFDSGNAPARLGYFQIASGRGRGCDVDGVALLNGNALEKSARASTLMQAQTQMMNCGGSTAFAVRADGESLIEIDGGWIVQQTVPPRLLLRVRGDGIETACHVEQQPSYAVGPLTETH